MHWQTHTQNKFFNLIQSSSPFIFIQTLMYSKFWSISALAGPVANPILDLYIFTWELHNNSILILHNHSNKELSRVKSYKPMIINLHLNDLLSWWLSFQDNTCRINSWITYQFDYYSRLDLRYCSWCFLFSLSLSNY